MFSVVCDTEEPVLRVRGLVDFHTGQDLFEELLNLLNQGHRRLTVEAPPETLDPSGVAVIQTVAEWLEDHQGCLELRNCYSES